MIGMHIGRVQRNAQSAKLPGNNQLEGLAHPVEKFLKAVFKIDPRVGGGRGDGIAG